MKNSFYFDFRPTEVKKITLGEFRKLYGDVILANDVFDDYNLLLVKGLMVHSEIRNRNGMGFKEEDLVEVIENGLFKSPKFGIMDYEHNFMVHGVWFDARLVEDNGVKAIETEGVLFAWLYPSMAEEVLGRYQMGKLYFSMAAVPRYIECSKCGHTIEWPLPYDRELAEKKMCSHMKKVLIERDLEGEDAIMYLRKPLFVANSIVRNPADEDADSIEAPQVTNLGEFSDNTMRNFYDLRDRYVFVTAEKIQEIVEEKQSSEEVSGMEKDKIDEDVIISAKLKVLRSNSKYLKGLPIEADARWSFKAKDGNAIIEKGGMKLYKKVHLAMDADGDPDLKKSYHFPVAKLVDGTMKIFRRGVIAAKVRAAQWKYDEVVKFASNLLDYIDKKLEKAGIEVQPVEEIEAELLEAWEKIDGGDIMAEKNNENINEEIEEKKHEENVTQSADEQENTDRNDEIESTEGDNVEQIDRDEDDVDDAGESVNEATDESVEDAKTEIDKIKELYAMLWAEKLNNKFGIEVTAEEKEFLSNFSEAEFTILISMIERIIENIEAGEQSAEEIENVDKKDKEIAGEIIENVTGNVGYTDEEVNELLREQMEKFRQRILKHQ